MTHNKTVNAVILLKPILQENLYKTSSQFYQISMFNAQSLSEISKLKSKWINKIVDYSYALVAIVNKPHVIVSYRLNLQTTYLNFLVYCYK